MGRYKVSTKAQLEHSSSWGLARASLKNSKELQRHGYEFHLEYMDNAENEQKLLNKTVHSIFSDFMTKVTKFDEMVSVSNKFLVGFHQHLEFLRRPSLEKTSELVDNIIKANETERMKAYLQSGCRNVHDGVQSISKLNTCQQGLQEHLSKGKSVLHELEMLMDDLVGVLTTADISTLQCQDEHICDGLIHEKEEMESTPHTKPVVTDYVTLMGFVFSMLTQDYSMQEKIVSSLNLNSSSGELESYCLMWSLRPFINDEIMHQAWRFIS
ncbi:hypothetical protein IFM89_032846 [Coptis chinensis]|uniref:DUF7795 domain-containing protein n=1 Tax=Coptis chinensis TaxID=261450 RepID=A0A835M7S7_9MAGN|nr:hypothetical protein IFM89_032846 [Coptis chinensis]